MPHKPAVIGAVAVLVVAGTGGIVAAGLGGPVAQTGTGPAATPDGPTPSEVTPEAPPTTPAEPQPSAGGVSGENTTISVTASASVSTAPDRVRIRAAVVATATEAETVRQQVAADVSATRAALREAGIADDQIQTVQFDISTVREPEANDSESVRYRAVNEFVVEVSPDRAGETIDVAVGNGTNQIDGVTFTLSDATRQTLRQRALREAVTSARDDADVIANASGVRITGLRSASTADVSFVPFEAQAAGGLAAESETVIEPGPIKVSATVSVTYQAE